jgi:PAS domain S-box-containing protein
MANTLDEGVSDAPAGIKSEYTWDDIEALQNELAVVISNPKLPDCPIVFANDAFLAHSGYEREEILGRNCRFMQGPQSEPAMVSKFRMSIAALAMAEIVITNYRKDGSQFVNHVLLRPLRQKDGKETLIVAVQRRLRTDKNVG